MGLGAGDLDRWVTVLRQDAVPDGYGGAAGEFMELGDPIPAMRRDVKDGERIAAGRLAGELVVRFTVRASTFALGIRRSDRLLCDGIEFAIVAIKEVPGARRAFLEITASAAVD